jgi:hypothetical protein
LKFFALFDFPVKDYHSVKDCHSREGGDPEKRFFTPFLLEQMPFLFNLGATAFSKRGTYVDLIGFLSINFSYYNIQRA